MTDRDLFQRADRIFREVCDLPAGERDGRIAASCGGDAELEMEVRALLDADSSPLAGALNTPAVAMTAGEVAGEEQTPERIGGFRIIRRLGAGGMGVVYEAEQDRPRRTVALKVIRSGVLSSGHRRRFELEAQLLARLQHPGIATIYETGSADTGIGMEPYFAMELIEGMPLTEYVRERALSQRDLLVLFAQICDAVHHAHQKGVIHRDLKPGNILVTPDGRPKILDFGVARLSEPEGESLAMHTSEGQLVGTLAYMSPEQVAGDPNALDTRSDVYSLGVLLYELLGGRPAHDLKNLALGSAVRKIAEEAPARLGTIAPACRGDVETIVGKALETDRDRRYDSAAALAADIRRFLSDEPISARPASTVYQLRKFARRNRGLVASAAVIVCVLTMSSVVASVLAVRAASARTEAVDALDREAKAHADAEAALEQSKKDNENYAAVLEFLQDMLRRADPAETGGDKLTLREAIDRAAVRLETEKAETPTVDASIRETIGETYAWIGLNDKGIPLLEQALETRVKTEGELSPDATRVRRKLSRLLSVGGDNERALKLMNDIEPAIRQAVEAGEPKSEELARVLHAKAIALKGLEQFDEAERCVQEAIDQYRLAGLAEDGAMGDALNTLGSILLRHGDYAGAEAPLLEALDLYRKQWGEDHARTATIYNNLSIVTRYLNRMDDAEEYAKKAYEVWERIAGGAPHEGLLSPEFNYGVLLARRGKTDEAIKILEVAVKHHDEIYHGNDPRQAFALDQLARLYGEKGRLDEAADLLDQARAILTSTLGERHPYIAVNLSSIARLRTLQHRYEDAVRLNREALDIYMETRGPDHPWTSTGQLNLAQSLIETGEPEEAEPLLIASMKTTETTQGAESPDLVQPLTLLGQIRLAKAPEEAEACYRRAVDIEQATGESATDLAEARSAWASALIELGRFEEAEATLLECHHVFTEADPPDPENAAKTAARLAHLFERTGDAEKARQWEAIAQAAQG
ncbi:MAG: serine/threonine-protein kinase [Phycisphaerales bacterium]